MSMSEKHFVVGIGASAGGLDAIERFFDAMPGNTGLAFVVVQHLSPDYKSMMSEILAQRTSMPIRLIADGMPISPNAIFLIPPRKNVELVDGEFRLNDQESHTGLSLPIDVFFRSLTNLKERAIVAILSGTGSDGSKGLRAIRGAGGLVLAQDPASSGFDGMPRNAAATGLVDVICAPASMPQVILEYCHSPATFRLKQMHLLEKTEGLDDKSLIFRRFHSIYGVDFSLYRQSTIDRRLERRIQMTRSASLSEYVAKLLHDEEELDHLYRDLLVEVTRFFRDPAAFELIRTKVAEPLIERGGNDAEIRIWVPGCATGEEAYSMAMVFHDAARRLDIRPSIRLFATEIHQRSLEFASSAVYASETMSDLPEEFKSEYFRQIGDQWQVTQSIRQLVIFAPHDLTRDPPFTNLSLISCRNVLIYLEPEVQQRVISLFHYGLAHNAFLFLGPSETVGKLDREFTTLDSHWRIYQKTRNVRLVENLPLPTAPTFSRAAIARGSISQATTSMVRQNSLISSAYESLLERYVPPSFLLNNRLELLHSFGEAVKFIDMPPGRPTVDILKMVCPELRLAISAAVHRAEQENGRFCFSGVKVPVNGIVSIVRVAVEPFRRNGDTMFLLTLEGIGPAPQETSSDQEFNAPGQTTSRIADLELELKYTGNHCRQLSRS